MLREVVTINQGSTHPVVSNLFGTDLQALHADAESLRPDWRDLPSVRLNPADPAATLVLNAMVLDPERQVGALREAVEQGHAQVTGEAGLGLARALIEVGDHDDAEACLSQVETASHRDWRVAWYRGLSFLAQHRPGEAQQIYDRLDSSFRLLISDERAGLDRHQTINATLAWSHDLLEEPERRLLRRLAVFTGWTLGQAEQVGLPRRLVGAGVAQRGIDLLAVDVEAALQPLIEGAERGPRRLDLRRRAGDRQLIAARHQRHAELALDPRQVLVMLAEQRAEQPIVVELEMQRRSDRRAGQIVQAGTCRSAAARRPARLFGRAARMAIGTTLPSSPAGAATSTAWA